MPYINTSTTRTAQYSSESSGGSSSQQTTTTRTIIVHDDGRQRMMTSTVSKGDDPQRPISASGASSLSFAGGTSSQPVTAGCGGSSGTGKTYADLKAELTRSRTLFEDPEFPAVDASICYSQKPARGIKWLRPKEICSNPEFMVGGASRFDVRQGELGDCWLLAAIASLSLHQELFGQVVPVGQNFSGSDYCGLFRFRFWWFGSWREVVVDDRLPTSGGRLVYMHSTEKNEFWSALLEKSYAKLCGSYEALKGGSSSEAMEDFTGGVTEMIDLRQAPPANLFDIMTQAQERCSLMGCSIDTEAGQKLEARQTNGLIVGHAYSVTDVKTINAKLPGQSGTSIRLVRVRNPWGNEAEWKGRWGDKSSEWQYISQEDKQRLGLNFEDDGEFWMSFEDFSHEFKKLEICHLGPQSLSRDQLGGKIKRRWEMCLEEGMWKRRVSAGGCRNFINTFWTNPQFRVTVVDPDDTDTDKQGTIIVGLMQREMRKKRREGLDLLTVGYVIYKLKDSMSSGPLDQQFFKFNSSVAKSHAFINLREVCTRHKLAPGNYVIVPSTFEPDQEAEFILRIFSERANQSQELDEETSIEKIKPNPVPAGADAEYQKELFQAFKAVAGVDNEVDAYELRDILNISFKQGDPSAVSPLSLDDYQEFRFDGFSIETCRSMVAMMDTDQSGKLGFDEFKVLWNDLRLWKTIFKQFDTDKSGTFNSYELRQALNSGGFHLSNKVFNALVMRFSTKEGVILFDDFILSCVRLKTVFEMFKCQPKTADGSATFDQDTFIKSTTYI